MLQAGQLVLKFMGGLLDVGAELLDLENVKITTV